MKRLLTLKKKSRTPNGSNSVLFEDTQRESVVLHADVAKLKRSLKTQSDRVPENAKPDFVMTQARLLLNSTPDSEVGSELLEWLAARGFLDILALQYLPAVIPGNLVGDTYNFALKNGLVKESSPSVDLCLWCSPERLLRSEIDRDPSVVPTDPSNMSHQDRARAVTESMALLKAAKDVGVITYHKMFLLHDDPGLAKVVSLRRRLYSPELLDEIASYFGTYVGFHFAWLQHTTFYLVIPAIFGGIVWHYQSGRVPGLKHEAHTADNEDQLLPVFNLFMAVWGTVLLQGWNRRAASLAYRWKVHNADDIARAKRLVGWSQEETGKVKLREVPSFLLRFGSGSELLFWMKMTVSILIEAVFLYFGVRVMLYFSWLEHHANDIYGDNTYRITAIRVGYVLVPMILKSALHKPIAIRLTKWEGHPQPEDVDAVKNAKLFAYAFVNAYSSLFYIAFFERDVQRLREVLITLLVTKQVFALTAAIIQPIASTRMKRSIRKTPVSASSSANSSANSSPRGTNSWNSAYRARYGQGHGSEIRCREGECFLHLGIDKVEIAKKMARERACPPFDPDEKDLDLMILFGYVTMFAVAFPLAPAIAMLRVFIEYRVEAWQLTHCRRPNIITRSGLGPWKVMLDLMGTCSIATNCMLLGLSSPETIKRRGYVYLSKDITFMHESVRLIICVIVVEHLLIFIKYLVGMVINDLPADLEKAMAEDNLRLHQSRRTRMLSQLKLAPDMALFTQQHQVRRRSFITQQHNDGGPTHTSSMNDLTSISNHSNHSYLFKSNSSHAD